MPAYHRAATSRPQLGNATASSLPPSTRVAALDTTEHNAGMRPVLGQPDPDRLGRVDENVDLCQGIDAGDPLTASGRTKKRQRDKETFDPDDPDRYRYKAYHIRRAFDLFGHIPTIVNDGIKRRAKELIGEDGSKIQSDQDFETFNLILNHLDGLNDDINRYKRNPKAFRALIRKIREAADQARNNDTANLKKDISCMLTPDGTSVLTRMGKGRKPSSKHDRGFDNDVMGKFLCPISLNWDNAIVRDEIRQGQHAILACDWPRLLYAECECDLDDLELGLGRNMALVRVVKYLFTGRSAAFSETAGGKTTRSGNAALAGMKEITPRVVAYAACMLRYAISNEESWSSIDKEFNLQEFYWHVVGIFDDSDAFGKELLAWWNMKVFGTSLETAKQQEVPEKTLALSMLRKQRQAKRTAHGVLANTTNFQDGLRDRCTVTGRSSLDSDDGAPVSSGPMAPTRISQRHVAQSYHFPDTPQSEAQAHGFASLHPVDSSTSTVHGSSQQLLTRRDKPDAAPHRQYQRATQEQAGYGTGMPCSQRLDEPHSPATQSVYMRPIGDIPSDDGADITHVNQREDLVRGRANLPPVHRDRLRLGAHLTPPSTTHAQAQAMLNLLPPIACLTQTSPFTVQQHQTEANISSGLTPLAQLPANARRPRSPSSYTAGSSRPPPPPWLATNPSSSVSEPPDILAAALHSVSKPSPGCSTGETAG